MKNKIAFIFFYLIIGYCSTSCNSQNTTKITVNNSIFTINIDSARVYDALPYSDIFKSVKIIALNNKEVLIGQIDKIQPYNDHLYILDSNIAKGLFEFNKNGDFIRKIGNLGSGPDEYTSCQDFAVNEQKDEILIFDIYRNHINIYDMQTGKYIRGITIKEEDKIECIWTNSGKLYGVDSYFISNDEKPYYILQQIDDTTGEIIAEWMETENYNKGWNDEFVRTPLFYPIDKDKDLFAFGLSDTIMCIQKDKLYPYITLTGKNRIKKNEIPKEMISSSADINIRRKNNNDLFNKFLRNNKFIYISCIFEHDNFIYIDYSTILSKRHLRFNKITNEISVCNFLNDDILYSKEPQVNSIPTFVTSDDKGVYSLLQAENLPEIKYFAQENGFISNLVINKNKLKEINEDSNPIILYYEFK